MHGLSSAELASMRYDIEALMPDYCYILELTRTPDGQGGWSEAWGTASANIKCRIDAINPSARNNEIVQGGALQPFHTYILSLPFGTAITTENRVEVNEQLYSVTAVDNGKSWSAVVRAVLELIDDSN